jgi:16S rRNA processing protein RimM
MNYIYVGKIVNTQGLKGEMKVISDFDYKELVFKSGVSIYIGNSKENRIISSHRIHKNFDIIKFEGYNDINDILKYKGMDIYILEELLNSDINYKNKIELIGLDVYVNDNIIGTVKEIMKTKANDILVVISEKNKRILIPNVKEIVTIESNKILVEDIKGLIS